MGTQTQPEVVLPGIYLTCHPSKQKGKQMELESLIKRAQSGDQQAKTELVQKMFDDGYIRQVNKYLYLNRLLKPNEVRSEFWYGVLKAMSRVKYDIGNPLQFLAFKGVMRVRSLLRKRISKGVFYMCKACGNQAQLRSLLKLYVKFRCQECGSEDIDTFEREIHVVEHHIERPKYSRREMHRTIHEKDKIRRFRSTLSGRQAEVFDWIIGGLTRYNSKNYLVEISELMDCTPQCVVQYLNKVREKYLDFV